MTTLDPAAWVEKIWTRMERGCNGNPFCEEMVLKEELVAYRTALIEACAETIKKVEWCGVGEGDFIDRGDAVQAIRALDAPREE